MNKQIDKTPFFIVGAPRSGTTLLRDILKSHTHLCSPEETFYFRWVYPYGTKEYEHFYRKNTTILDHRGIDQLEEEEYWKAFESGKTRKDIMDFHGASICEKQKKRRWFDKTPQNVYGLPLMSHYYPTSYVLHIYRHPLNVVSSLIEGKQIKGHTIDGAINYWIEAQVQVDQYRRLHSEFLIEIAYEELTLNPAETITRICSKLNEDASLITFPFGSIHQENNKWSEVLSAEQIASVMKATESFRVHLGYPDLLPD